MTNLSLKQKFNRLDWTFRGTKAKDGIHGIHSYPAMMAPPVARRLIADLTTEGSTVLDPFCGSATVLTEAVLLKRKAIGYDINPLALLIAKAKTTPLSSQKLRKSLAKIEERFSLIAPENIPNFFNINFWFNPEVIMNLAKLKHCIEREKEKEINDFFKVIFARTVRQTSNTRRNEFKLFRLPDEKLRVYAPDVYTTFTGIALKSINLMEEFWSSMNGFRPQVDIKFHDSRQPFPLTQPVDLMLTSPPYGDSRTTVAYGQFSRLALQWLDMWGKDVDKEGLGGEKALLVHHISSLKKVLVKINKIDIKRGQEVEAFYQDLYLCLVNISKAIKIDGFAVFVIANRKVKGTVLPTDKMIIEMMKHFNFKHIVTLHREIPNKRMPLKNSPSNIPGQIDATMLKENIVLFQKK